MKKYIVLIILLSSVLFAQRNRVIREIEFKDSVSTLRSLITSGYVTLPAFNAHRDSTETHQDTVLVNGSYNYISQLGQVLTLQQIDLATDVTGTLPDGSLSGDYTFANLTLTGDVSVSGTGTFTSPISVNLSTTEGTPTISGATGLTVQRNGATGFEAGIGIISGSTGFGRIDFGDKDDDDRGVFGYNQSTDTFEWTTATTSAMTLNGTGGLSISGTVSFDVGDQDWDVIYSGSGGSSLAFQGQTSGVSAPVDFLSKDNDGTDFVGLNIYGFANGAYPTVTNRELLRINWNNSNTQYEIQSLADGTGTLRPVVLFTEGNTDQLVLATDGNVGIGTDSPETTLDILGDDFQLRKLNAQPIIYVRRSDTSVNDNNTLGIMKFTGDDASAVNQEGASIRAIADEDWSSGSTGGRIEFWTTTSGTETEKQSVRVDSDGTLNALFDLSVSGNVSAPSYRYSTSEFTAATADGSDNSYIGFGGGGGGGSTRGAYFYLSGNERSGFQGQFELGAGEAGSANSTIVMKTNNTLALEVDISQNVSIPSGDLSVSGNVTVGDGTLNNQVILYGTNAGNSQLVFASPTDATGSAVGWNHDGKAMFIQTNSGSGKINFRTAEGVDALELSNAQNGRFYQDLQVDGNVSVSGDVDFGNASIGSPVDMLYVVSENYSAPLFGNPDRNVLTIKNNGSTATYPTIGSGMLFIAGDSGGGRGGIMLVRNGSGDGDLVLMTGGGVGGGNTAEGLRVIKGGDVSIPNGGLSVSGMATVGTASPESGGDFQVYSTGNADLDIATTSATNDALLKFYINGGNTTGTRKGTILYDYSDDAFQISYGADGNDISIDSNHDVSIANDLSVSGTTSLLDSVGIGTSSPSDLFHISGVSPTAWFESTSGNGMQMKMKNTEGEVRFEADDNAWNVRVAGSGGDHYVFTSSELSMTTDLSVSGDAELGDASSDSVNVNGIFRLKDTAWEDLRMPVTRGKLGANQKPDFDTTNVALLFPQNDPDEVIYMITQMPHGWKEGTDLEAHFHWLQENSDSCTWKLSYKWTDIGETLPASWTTLTGSELTYTYSSGSLHQLTELGMISGSGHTFSSILQLKFFRDDNVYSGDAKGLELDFHYEIDKLGTNNEYDNL